MSYKEKLLKKSEETLLGDLRIDFTQALSVANEADGDRANIESKLETLNKCFERKESNLIKKIRKLELVINDSRENTQKTRNECSKYHQLWIDELFADDKTPTRELFEKELINEFVMDFLSDLEDEINYRNKDNGIASSNTISSFKKFGEKLLKTFRGKYK